MSEKNKKTAEQSISFQLKGIELLDFCFNNPKNPIPDQMVFNFEIRIEHKLLTENNIIAVVISIDINRDQKEAKLGSLMASCIFEVPALKEYTDPKKTLPDLPQEFLTTLNSISLSTVRGIMFSQFRGTILHNAILPVLDPKSFVTQ